MTHYCPAIQPSNKKATCHMATGVPSGLDSAAHADHELWSGKHLPTQTKSTYVMPNHPPFLFILKRPFAPWLWRKRKSTVTAFGHLRGKMMCMRIHASGPGDLVPGDQLRAGLLLPPASPRTLIKRLSGLQTAGLGVWGSRRWR